MLTPSMLAYNSCVEAKDEAWTRLLTALDDYNRAVGACEQLFSLGLFQRATLHLT